MKTRDYNVLLSFYPHLQDNACLQDNDRYPLSNLILDQIQTLNKRMSLIETLFLYAMRLLHYKYRYQCMQKGDWKRRHKKPRGDYKKRGKKKKPGRWGPEAAPSESKKLFPHNR